MRDPHLHQPDDLAAARHDERRAGAVVLVPARPPIVRAEPAPDEIAIERNGPTSG
jgi:hypothetical protein